MATLFTNGVRITLRQEDLAEYDQIAVSEEDLSGSVMLKLRAAGQFDLAPLLGERGADVLGSASNDLITTGPGDDTIFGAAGNDTLDGGLGADRIFGGGGDDRLLVLSGRDRVVEYSGGTGYDRLVIDPVETTITRLVLDKAASVEVLELVPAAFEPLAGLLWGTEGADYFDLSGVKVFSGFFGDVGGSLADADLGGGDDFYRGNGTWGVVFGRAGNDTLIGGQGNNYFAPGLGEDRVICGGGADIIILSESELSRDAFFGGGGSDTITIQRDISLRYLILDTAASVETLNMGVGEAVLSGTDGDDVFNLSGVRTLRLADFIDLGAGNDRFEGSGSSEGVIGGTGHDSLYGGAGMDRFLGGDGNDRLDGGSGDDWLDGGAGSNTYVVDSLSDQVHNELGDAASSTIETALASFTLGDANPNTPDYNVWNLKALGSAGCSLVGDAHENRISGGVGNDELVGLGGVDTLVGGKGDDIYITDGQDKLIEFKGEGIDLILSGAADTTLAENFENLSLISPSGAIGRGNALNNTIHGSFGNDTIDGRAGNDRMIGGDGDDIYIVDAAGDIVEEEAGLHGLDGVGTDLARYALTANVEFLIGVSDQGQVLLGNLTDNWIAGDDGNDTLNGSGGADSLNGGLGADVFVFNAPLLGVDMIEDFMAGDAIHLDAIPGNLFSGLAPGALATGAFRVISSGGKAADADDRILYDKEHGRVYFDADGQGGGAAVLFLTLVGGTQLAATDFFVI